MNFALKLKSVSLHGSFLRLLALWLCGWSPVWATDATDGPGVHACWTTGAKEGIGTSVTSTSNIWFTLAQGILTEVYYPRVDTPNVQDLQFVITDSSTFVDLERDATHHDLKVLDDASLLYQQLNTAKNGRYRITKTYFTDPSRPSLFIDTRFEVLNGGPLKLYVLYNPSLDNSGSGDKGATDGDVLVADDGPIASALRCRPAFLQKSSGYSVAASDGLLQLKSQHHLTVFDSANSPGNLVQTAEVDLSHGTSFVLALAFGANRHAAKNNVNDSLADDQTSMKTTYQSGWHDYLHHHIAAPKCITDNGLLRNYNFALMALKAHEDKTTPGAHVASLTIPWGNIVEANVMGEGYHRVWSRDLYQVATALLAAGDKEAALNALKFLVNVQEESDGRFPRFSKIDGSERGSGDQLDQYAFPIILAWQLRPDSAPLWPKLKLTADQIRQHGPRTAQERWEEQIGISPSTIAAEIAALICAADMARTAGDAASANTYETTADSWQHDLETWTVTTNGTFGGNKYYERIENDQNPNDNFQRYFNDGGWWERDVVDAGFLELVRLGIKPADDETIIKSLAVIDGQIRHHTPGGDMWYRYNHDGYGEDDHTGEGWRMGNTACRGRLWPLLSGERGEYELARNGKSPRAVELLKAMAAAANKGYMIPEQCWDRGAAFGYDEGKGTGSATPLCWSMAQFVRLALSIDKEQPVETPAIVKARYIPAH